MSESQLDSLVDEITRRVQARLGSAKPVAAALPSDAAISSRRVIMFIALSFIVCCGQVT